MARTETPLGPTYIIHFHPLSIFQSIFRDRKRFLHIYNYMKKKNVKFSGICINSLIIRLLERFPNFLWYGPF